LIESDVPLGKGVSSSAALEVAALKAIAAAYGIFLAGVDLAIKCQWIENAICQSACGVMDQLTVVVGERNHFVPLICQPCLPQPLVKLPDPVKLWGIDSGVRHQVAGIEYEGARAATFMGYQIICRSADLELTYDDSGLLPLWRDPRWNGYLANLSPSDFRKDFETSLPESMTGADFSARYPFHVDPFTKVYPGVSYPVRACTRYAVEENHRVQLFVDLLTSRDEPLSERTLSLLGELMRQSHYAYSECGLGSEATDLIVDLVRAEGSANGLYGAKITGGGAGGTVAVLGKNEATADKAFERVIQEFSQATGYNPYIFTGSSSGADAFGLLEMGPKSALLSR
jgi:galactokinase